ncbi:MAG: DUF1549 domain-containing protein [Planctomycetaceae bacterium]|nr:DUF1549 domain-containing protein [Planctomycetaceae bacterium]
MRPLTLGVFAVLLGVSFSPEAIGAEKLTASPAVIHLTTPEAADQVLVWDVSAAHGPRDVTGSVTYVVNPPNVVQVSAEGRVTPIQDGHAVIEARSGNAAVMIKADVTGATHPSPVSFQRDVLPILSKAACNAGGCHGKAEGQNGFKLSVFGSDAGSDYQALVMEARGRRVVPSASAQSLLLLKGAALIPHGGGRKIEPGSRWYQKIDRWIREGARYDTEATDNATGIAIEPAEITLPAHGQQQLRVVVRTADGQQRGVTAECEFQTNNGVVADVDSFGIVTATDVPGEAGILVRYRGHVAVSRVIRPQVGSPFVRPPERNFIDKLAWDKLEQLGLTASPLSDDATFLRRASLDVTGTLPTVEEAREFLADTAADKRAKLVERLLKSPVYADYWSQRWADLLQVDKDVLTPQGAVAFTRWIRDQCARNVPYDEFVASILTAEGSTLAESPAGFFQVQKDPEKLARSVSQVFLGVRIECAQCHHHPFERWDQHDYFAFAGFFTGVTRPQNPLGGLKILDSGGDSLKHPRTGEPISAAGLGAPPADFPDGTTRRAVLADWVTSPENPFFARLAVNRLWSHYYGRGLVEPVDDLRATNPATNEPLLAALAERFVALDFDVKAFTRELLDSRVYQLASTVDPGNASDEQNHSRAAWKPLSAEVLLDAISQVTGVPEEFNGWPVGYRAIQVWDNKLPSDFLEVFGRPARQSVCACERQSEPSMAQALHLMNSAGTSSKLASRSGHAARLATSSRSDDEVIDELMLATLSRFPSPQERERFRKVFSSAANRREAVEDILWALLNTKEFVFNH